MGFGWKLATGWSLCGTRALGGMLWAALGCPRWLGLCYAGAREVSWENEGEVSGGEKQLLKITCPVTSVPGEVANCQLLLSGSCAAFKRGCLSNVVLCRELQKLVWGLKCSLKLPGSWGLVSLALVCEEKKRRKARTGAPGRHTRTSARERRLRYRKFGGVSALSASFCVLGIGVVLKSCPIRHNSCLGGQYGDCAWQQTPFPVVILVEHVWFDIGGLVLGNVK